jgi:hypothetical protein
VDRLLDRFWIWSRFWEGIANGYITGTGCYRPKIFVNPSRPNGQQSPPSPDTVIGIRESATVAPSRSKPTNLRRNFSSTIAYRWRGDLCDSFALSSNGCGGWALDRILTDLESENGFEKILPLATILVQGFIAQRYSLTPVGPIHTKSPTPDNRHIGQTIGPILNLKTVLRTYCTWLQNWYRLL